MSKRAKETSLSHPESAPDDVGLIVCRCEEVTEDQVGNTLSGGEQQMLAIGRALMGAPNPLLLDEPSLGLAPVLVERVFETLHRIREEGTTSLLVEQNARAALRLADKAYVLEVGNIAMEGSGAELLRDPRVQEAYLGGRR
jgi:branched-chain amino acid transport system ATP-binding protein